MATTHAPDVPGLLLPLIESREENGVDTGSGGECDRYGGPVDRDERGDCEHEHAQFEWHASANRKSTTRSRSSEQSPKHDR